MSRVILIFGSFILCLLNDLSGQNLTDSLDRRQGAWNFTLVFDSMLRVANPLVVCHFSNDTLNGNYTIYDKETLRFEATYNKGLKEGLAFVYYPNNRINAIFFYVNDTIRSVMEFSEKGRLRKAIETINDDKEGWDIEIHDNARIHIKRFYSSHKISLPVKEYYKNGKLRYITTYSDRGIVNEISFRRNGKKKYGIHGYLE